MRAWGRGAGGTPTGTTVGAVGVPRLLRAALVTGIVVLLGGGAHASAGGGAPTPFVAALLTVLGLPVAWWATGRRLGRARLLALVGGGQVAVHTALLGMRPAVGSSPGHSPYAAHLSAHAHATAPDPAALSGPVAALHLTPGMLAGHLVATLVAVWVLGHGERLVRAALDRLLPRLTPTLSLAPRPLPPLGCARRPRTGTPLLALGARAPPA